MNGERQAGDFGPPLYLAEIFHATAKQYKFILIVMAVFTLLGVAYCVLAERQFTARVSLLPVASRQDGVSLNGGGIAPALSRLGGFFNVGQPVQEADVAFELAQSRNFVRDMLATYPKLNAQILPDCTVVKSENSQKPECGLNDIWKAVAVWKKDIFHHGLNKDNGLYWVEVVLPDPVLAADVANTAVSMMDQRLRAMRLKQSSGNIKYLSQTLETTVQADIRHTITGILQKQLEQQMLASNQDAYVFQVLEAAAPAAAPSSPRVPLIIIASVVLGLVFGVAAAFVRASRKVLSGSHQPVFKAA